MSVAPQVGATRPQNAYGNETAESVQRWFEQHVSLDGKPYILDHDQANAVLTMNLNTLVVARAGSGKTRVIVAKIAYLIAHCHFAPTEILVFMFNRTAAIEVNQRIANVEVDRQKLLQESVEVASTFHKFALNIVRSFQKHPKIISEEQRSTLLEGALKKSLQKLKPQISPREYQELRSLVSNFINRASQKYPGTAGFRTLEQKITEYHAAHCNNPAYRQKVFWHRVAFESYKIYRQSLYAPNLDFNMLMALATELLQQTVEDKSITSVEILQQIQNVRFIMIDEYQDFSYLFLSLTNALRRLTKQAKLFVVGDDWQAINRFAGSDVDYFINFSKYFTEDAKIIPLATNYRSDRRIVERANQFMLREYDPTALPAKAFNTKKGKIRALSPNKIRFRADDLAEDGLGDGRYLALTHSVPAAKLLKLAARIIRQHHNAEIMLLHRHNYTSFNNLSLTQFINILETIVVKDGVMSHEDFQRQVRGLTMHRSKGLEADVVILLELDRKIVRASHPHATAFSLFDDTLAAETADQQRLLYVAMTRARHYLYLLSDDRNPLV